ncbi:MAG: IS5 family transposase [Pyrinomonadaceae bacterium]
MATKPTLPTIWHIPDRLWKKIRPLLGREKRPGTPGRPVVPYRTVFDGILYVLRTGCQWKRAPEKFGSGSTLHRRFQQWRRRGVFTRLWRIMLREYDSRRGIRWLWQAIDSAMTKAPLGGEATGKNPTDRAKSGTKRHVVCDQRGAPLALCVTGANRHDKRVALRVVDAIMVERPAPTEGAPQHLCGDKGYDFADVREGLTERGYTAHIPVRGTPAFTGKRRRKAKRWVVERAHSWLNRHRRLLVRWEKSEKNYVALIYFAFALQLYRLIVLG